MLHGLMPWPDSQTVKARSKLFWGLEAEAAASWPLWLPGFLASWLPGFLASWLPSAATECNLCQSLTRN